MLEQPGAGGLHSDWRVLLDKAWSGAVDSCPLPTLSHLAAVETLLVVLTQDGGDPTSTQAQDLSAQPSAQGGLLHARCRVPAGVSVVSGREAPLHTIRSGEGKN